MKTMYTAKKASPKGRRGSVRTHHGAFHTPAFMTIATRGAVKTIEARELQNLGADILLSNTYHLYVKPGVNVLRSHKGLHGFMGWHGPILTDSGGYQVFSLAKLRTLTENGARFSDPISGERHTLTPEKVVDIQQAIGSDIMMVLDECPPFPATREYVERSMKLTTRWALRCLAHKKKKRITTQSLFAIVQGGVYRDLRQQHAKELSQHDFDGFAIGGLAVGEPEEKMYQAIEATMEFLPKNKPRYLMGVGYPHQIKKAVELGVDMFDCVLPTRNARHGNLFVWKNQALSGSFYTTLQIKNAKFARDIKPVDQHCDCPLCSNYSRSYIRHLFSINEPLAMRLASQHNIRFYQKLMELLRKRI